MKEKIKQELTVVQTILNTLEIFNEKKPQATELIEVAREKIAEIFKVLENGKLTGD